MKNLYLFLIVLGTAFTSCQVDELLDSQVPQPNSLASTAAAGTSAVLSQSNASNPFTKLSWTSTDFGSHPVTYSIEMDKAGKEFFSARDILSTKDLKADFTVEKINSALIAYGIKPGETAEMEFRVRSWVNYLTTPGLSNTVKFTLTPYQLQFPPIFIIGDAQAWNLNNGVALTSTSPGVYTGKANFLNNGKFRFFAAADWASTQYGWTHFVGGAVPAQFTNPADNDSNFLFAGISADYNVTVNLNSKTVSIELAGPPPPPSSVFLVTAQTVDLNSAVEVKSKSPGEYEGIIMLEKNTKFRIFTGNTWSADKLAFGAFDTQDELLQNSGDDVSNFLFKGETGYYILKISLKGSSIDLEQTEAPAQTLYILGDPQGWNLGNALAMRSLGNNVFEGVGNFKTNQIFRFFVEADWAADQYGWSSFKDGTVDTELTDGGGGDSNFKFAAANGVYKITVSLSEKTISVEPVSTPELFIVGDDQGWNFNNAVSMTWLGGGKFQATTTFTNNSIFRFFEMKDWGAAQWKYSSFTGGTVDTDFADGGGADSNFRFVGTTGNRTITVDINAKTIAID